MNRATDIKLIDLISLKPGSLLRLHAVKGETECVPQDEFERFSGWKDEVSKAVLPRHSAKSKANFSKLLDIPIEFQVLIRHEDDNVVEVLRMEPGWWQTILNRSGKRADLMVDGKVMAHGIIVNEEDQQGILITRLASEEPQQ